MALRRPLDVERAFHRIEPALVVERTYLRLVEVDAGRLVGDHRVVVPGIPETAYHVDEFRCDLVAEVMLVEPFLAEIERGFVVGAGDHVPTGAAVAEVIERSDRARNVVGLAEA